MNVRLPNGTIIKNVPEGTTKDDIVVLALRNNLASEEDFSEYRKSLDVKLEQAQVERAVAAKRLEGSEDSIVENLVEGAAQLAQGVNYAALDAIDFVRKGLTDPFLSEEDEFVPLRQRLKQAQTAVTGDTREDFVEEKEIAEILETIGTGVTLGASFAPVTRAGTSAVDVASDILGLGMSTGGSTAANALVREAQNLSQSPTVQARVSKEIQKQDKGKVQNLEDASEDEIYEAAVQSATRQVVRNNRNRMQNVEESAKAQQKADKTGEALDEDQLAPEMDLTAWSSREVIQDLVDRGADANQALRIIGKRKGINLDKTLQDPELLSTLDRQMDIVDGNGKNVGWYDTVATPIAAVLRRNVGRLVGGLYDRAAETTVRERQVFMDEIVKPLTPVIKLVENNRQLAEAFGDLHLNPDLMESTILPTIRAELGEKALTDFNRFRNYNKARNQRANNILYTQEPDAILDIDYIHMAKEAEETERPFKMLGDKTKAEAPDAIRERTRSSFLDGDEDILTYQNPLISHIRHLEKEIELVQLAEKFELPATLAPNATNSDAFFEALADKLRGSGATTKQVDLAIDAIKGAYVKGNVAPNALVRSFMSQAIGFTLDQVKSAVMNFHDIFVSMVNNGVAPTLQALTQSNKKVFGKTLTQLGIGDAQGAGEFIKHFEDLTGSPSGMEWVAKKSKDIASINLLFNGFRLFDRINKGVILRAAVNKAKKAAKNNTLYEEFGDVLTREELSSIRKYLAEDTPANKIPEKPRKLIEELAFTSLGKQQLISIAGRPMEYIKKPNLRPAWALTGFALKQQELLRQGIVDNLKKGNKRDAAAYLARYVAYGGLGLGLIEEVRDPEVQMGKREIDPTTVLFGMIDQPLSVVTLNKLDREYGFNKFMADPVNYLMESFIPPTGFVGDIFKIPGWAIEDGSITTDGTDKALEKLSYQLPVVGDYIKEYNKD